MPTFTKKPSWFSPQTGIYNSIYSPVSLPSHPCLDVVSHIFSRKHKGVSALVDSSSGLSISYQDLYPLVQSMASGLQTMGVKQGDVVMILLPNSVYFPVILLGVMYVGAIVSTMNPLSSFSELKKQTLECHAKLAFTLVDSVDKLSALGVSVVAVPERFDYDSVPSEFSCFYELIRSDASLLSRPVIRQEDTAAIMHSSGTTGTCKGVVLTHKNFIAMVELFVRFEASQYELMSWENVYLAVLPMFHIYGLSLFVMGLLSLGSRIIVMRKFNVDEMPVVIHRYGVTHFPVVPPLLAALTRAAQTYDKSKFKSLKQVSCGAASLNTKNIEDFVRVLPHVDFIQGYGMTESTAVATRGFNTEGLCNYSSLGLLSPNMEAKVVDSLTGIVKGPGSIGELWLRGPSIMKGYLNNVEETMSTIDKEGWLHTGDICYFDKNGYLYLIDRVKEIIKYNGFQIAPAELEAILIAHPKIADVGVTAARDEETGEVPVAFVVTKHGSSVSEAELINYIAKQVAPYKKVRKVVFTNSIPRSAAGKILRRELRCFLSSKI
ncbi:4-coumarate--CoA ligase-like 6 [Heracleum sosnowskyi]|uniref:4-coumarate--CoA ligase n=1 Tax=Heracleum sosnowskyi TaxID=360622 RepID=A0AAD8HXE3_9APIA|nr:4-coumarate--CoA ligase-like 6 [Heracleum sosnowskyi]